MLWFTCNLFRFSHSKILRLHSDNLSSNYSFVCENKMFSMRKNKLLVSINNHIQGMHLISNDINANGRWIWEIEHNDVPKKIWTGIWNRPYCQWNRIFKSNNKQHFFSHKLMLTLVNINRNWHRQNRCVL